MFARFIDKFLSWKDRLSVGALPKSNFVAGGHLLNQLKLVLVQVVTSVEINIVEPPVLLLELAHKAVHVDLREVELCDAAAVLNLFVGFLAREVALLEQLGKLGVE